MILGLPLLFPFERSDASPCTRRRRGGESGKNIEQASRVGRNPNYLESLRLFVSSGVWLARSRSPGALGGQRGAPEGRTKCDALAPEATAGRGSVQRAGTKVAGPIRLFIADPSGIAGGRAGRAPRGCASPATSDAAGHVRSRRTAHSAGWPVLPATHRTHNAAVNRGVDSVHRTATRESSLGISFIRNTPEPTCDPPQPDYITGQLQGASDRRGHKLRGTPRRFGSVHIGFA